jgi:hypothetical protein
MLALGASYERTSWTGGAGGASASRCSANRGNSTRVRQTSNGSQPVGGF